MPITSHLTLKNYKHLMIYTTGAHNTPYLRTILGHPYTYIYIYIYKCMDMQVTKVYNYISGSPNCVYIHLSWKHPVETHKASGTQSAHMLLMLQPPQSLFQFKPTSVRQATHFARQLATFLTVLFHSSPWQKHGCSNSFQTCEVMLFLKESSMSTPLSDPS